MLGMNLTIDNFVFASSEEISYGKLLFAIFSNTQDYVATDNLRFRVEAISEVATIPR